MLRISILILFVLPTYFQILAQEWVGSPIIDYIGGKNVGDICATNCCLWFDLSRIVKYDRYEFESYYLDPYSCGELNKFKEKRPFNDMFHMVSSNNVICLYDNEAGRILKIENNYVYNYDFKSLNFIISEMTIDDNDNIWFTSLKSGYAEWYTCEIYRIVDNVITIYELPSNHKEISVSSFCVNKGYKYIIVHDGELDGQKRGVKNKLLIIGPDEILKEYELDTYKLEDYGFKVYVYSDEVYFLSGNGILYRVVDSTIQDKFIVSEKELGRFYDFVVIDDNVYCSSLGSEKRFFKYNLSTGNTIEIKIHESFKLMFDEMVVYENYIIGKFFNGYSYLSPSIRTLKIR